MGDFRIWIALLVVIISSSVSFAQESSQVKTKTGRSKQPRTKPASFRKTTPSKGATGFRRTTITDVQAEVLSIKTVVQPGDSGAVYVIVTLSKAVDRLWIYVHSADPAGKDDVPYIRHAKRVPITALSKAGIKGLKGNLPRYLCPIPKKNLKKLNGEALLSVTFAITKQPRKEVSSCWYYHLATNTSSKVVDVPSKPVDATSPKPGQSARVLKGS